MSPGYKPFPHKEMIDVSWGLKVNRTFFPKSHVNRKGGYRWQSIITIKIAGGGRSGNSDRRRSVVTCLSKGRPVFDGHKRF